MGFRQEADAAMSRNDSQRENKTSTEESISLIEKSMGSCFLFNLILCLAKEIC